MSHPSFGSGGAANGIGYQRPSELQFWGLPREWTDIDIMRAICSVFGEVSTVEITAPFCVAVTFRSPFNAHWCCTVLSDFPIGIRDIRLHCALRFPPSPPEFEGAGTSSGAGFPIGHGNIDGPPDTSHWTGNFGDNLTALDHFISNGVHTVDPPELTASDIVIGGDSTDLEMNYNGDDPLDTGRGIDWSWGIGGNPPTPHPHLWSPTTPSSDSDDENPR